MVGELSAAREAPRELEHSQEALTNLNDVQHALGKHPSGSVGVEFQSKHSNWTRRGSPKNVRSAILA